MSLRVGTRDLIQLTDASGQAQAEFNLHGGRLTQLTMAAAGKQVKVIHTETPLVPDTPYHSSPLAPWPNRIADGSYSWAGQSYTVPINEPQRQCALHGLLYDKPWTIAKRADSHSLTLGFTHDGSNPGYPWPFELRMQYVLQAHELTITWTATTTHTQSIPFCLGWHPYYYVPAGIDQALLYVPGTDTYVTNERLLPLARVPRSDAHQTPTVLGDTFYDQCFVAPGTARAEVVLSDPARNIALHLWQDAGSGRFGWFQVYTTPERNRICIEPMTCPPNAFQSGEGLYHLGAGQPLVLQSGIRIAEL